MIQRAIRMNSTTKSLYFEFFKLELLWVEKMRQRAQLMKLPSSEILQDNDSTEKTTIKLATLTNEEESKIIPPIETMEDDKKDAVGSELLLAQAVYRNSMLSLRMNCQPLTLIHSNRPISRRSTVATRNARDCAEISEYLIPAGIYSARSRFI